MKIPIEEFLLVDCGELYQHNSLLCLSVNNGKKNLSVYTKGITVDKEKNKKNNKIQWSVIFT